MFFPRENDNDFQPRFRTSTQRKIDDFMEGKNQLENKPGWMIKVAAVLVIILAAYFVGFALTFIRYGFSGVVSASKWKYFWVAFTTPVGLIATVLVAVVVATICYFVMHKNNELNQIKKSDERGVDFAEKGTYGTAEWMTKEEAKKIYEVGNIDEVDGVILGQFSQNGQEVVCLPKNIDANKNIIILGSPGTGKSFCYVRNAVFQSIIREESVVITDPKGELYESTADKLRKEGYTVWVYNLIDPLRSDAWNIMSEIYDPVTGNISDTRVVVFCSTIITNTSTGKSDPFWDKGEENLLKALVQFCAWNREVSLKVQLEAEGRRLSKHKSRLNPTQIKTLLSILLNDNIESTMKEREKAISLLVKGSLEETKSAEEILENIKLKAPVCDIAAVYHMLINNDVKELEEKFKVVPNNNPAKMAWNIFNNGSDNTKPGFVQGLGQRLQLFQMRDIRRISCNDGISFERLGYEKIALFCVISDDSSAMQALTSLFFTFLFSDVTSAADREGAENRKFINVICDEFANLGVIPNFGRTIGTARGRKINISIILQSITQLDTNYGPSVSKTIQDCCSTTLFLGCNELETAEAISAKAGIASIRVVSTKDTRSTSLGTRGLMQGFQLGEGDGKRPLINPDEVMRLAKDEVLIFHSGCNVLKVKRCGYIYHRFFKDEIPISRLVDYPLTAERYKSTESLDAFDFGLDKVTETNKRIAQERFREEARRTKEERLAKSPPTDENKDTKVTESDAPTKSNTPIFSDIYS